MRNFGVFTNQEYELSSSIVRSLMLKVYNWMGFGLFLSAISSFFVLTNRSLYIFAARNMMLLGIAEIALVLGFSFMLNKIKSSTALLIFLGYSLLNGLTIGVILGMYTGTSVASTFIATASMFGAMSVYGYVTKRDLTKMGNFLFMGIIGIFVASLINIFLKSSALSWTVSFLGVIIFVGLTAFDTQKIKNLMISQYIAGDKESMKKVAIIGALTLYLDFINMFLFLLRFMGSSRD
jgi:FtsH-binding integral membrane protein